ncbi:MAG: hypothetical protein COB36_12015 [Alphaproteobacteria bacterium]|nr:MAG: hypothetical protein COB36_12015 [Alphaproteobacteria bacterium]
MGQGTESCGGYDVEYNPYEEGINEGMWTEKSGSTISVTDMTDRHIKGAIRVCQGAAKRASFSCDAELWEAWIEVFNNELFYRVKKPSSQPKLVKAKTGPKTKPRGSMVAMKCHCGKEYQARKADLNRGWGKSCGKRCASIKREYGRPDATPVK